MKKYFKIIVMSLMLVLSSQSFAGLRTGYTPVIEVRPFHTGDVYITIGTSGLCDTTVFRIKNSDPGRDVMYSAVLSALMTTTKISIEIVNTGCAGWGTPLRSVYVKPE